MSEEFFERQQLIDYRNRSPFLISGLEIKLTPGLFP